MSTPADTSQYDAVLKEIYRPELVEMVTSKRRPLIGFFPKSTKYGGEITRVPVQFANPQGRSHSFSVAQGNVTDAQWKKWNITTGENHSLAHVTSKDVARSVDKPRSFIEILKNAVDGAKKSLADSIETELPRSGSGELGTISSGSTVASSEITLDNIQDVVNFEQGMTLVAAGSATGAVRSGTEVLKKVNRITGVLTSTSATWDTNITAIATGDSLFVEGDANNNDEDKALNGLKDWLPATTPTDGESFFGMDRSTDSRLYGVYEDLSSSTTLEEALIDHESRIVEVHEGMPDHQIIHNAQMRRLKKELGAKKEYQSTVTASGTKGEIAKISYAAVALQGEGSDTVKVMSCHKVPVTALFTLQRDTWEVGSIGQLVRFDDTDGKRVLRRATASGVEVRIVSWANLVCKAPGYNGQGLLPSVS